MNDLQDPRSEKTRKLMEVYNRTGIDPSKVVGLWNDWQKSEFLNWCDRLMEWFEGINPDDLIEEMRPAAAAKDNPDMAAGPL